jgi:hypothetical protein
LIMKGWGVVEIGYRQQSEDLRLTIEPGGDEAETKRGQEREGERETG